MIKKKKIAYTLEQENLIYKIGQTTKDYESLSQTFLDKYNQVRSPSTLQVKYSNLTRKRFKPLTIVSKNEFKDDEGNIQKEHARNRIINAFHPEGRTFTFPADNFKTEFKLLQHKPKIQLFCLEQNPEVFNRGVFKAMEFNIPYYNYPAEEYFKNVIVKPFTNMWLDFCVSWTNSVKNFIQIVAEKGFIKPNGIFAISLNVRGDTDLEELKRFLTEDQLQEQANRNDDWKLIREYGIPAQINELFNNDLHLVDYYPYKSMVQFIFKYMPSKEIEEMY